MSSKLPKPAREILNGDNADPFAYLGLHDTGNGIVLRAFLPTAHYLTVIDATSGEAVGVGAPIHPDGLFEISIASRHELFTYRLRVAWPGGELEIDDPYRFPTALGDIDRYLLAEGTHLHSYEKLGAHPFVFDCVVGTRFAVWAPNARRVSVVGDFNHWDGRRHPMRFHPGCGIWDIFIPHIGIGTVYKFEIKAKSGALMPLKSDPFAFRAEHPPQTASIVAGLNTYHWTDDDWMTRRAQRAERSAPISIYEVHLGSWRRADGNRYLTWRELTEQLVPYVKDMGFTHIELLPVSEHPFDGSWGYQPISLYAPTSRHGDPEDFKALIDAFHAAGIGVILDWVVGHFPEDAHGLVQFDGTHLYGHADPRQGRHTDWGTLTYNYGRAEVSNYLISNALFWLEYYHIDALRVDAVASMLYLDYSRKDGEWISNRHGGRENLEAIDFLRRLNTLVYERAPGAFTVAEESTAWPMVSKPTWLGGLGFGYKWNMGWMNDTLRYISQDSVHRKYHHNELTFALLYAFDENFVLPISHDEVVHGKASMLGRMPGDSWQRFANLRAYYAYMFAHPGKKLLFMGCEFAQGDEWSHDKSLDWHLLDYDCQRGMQSLVRDLNRLYHELPMLHVLDCEGTGFSWIDCNDNEQSVIAWMRFGRDPDDIAVAVSNFTPVIRHGYRIGVPRGGIYDEILNTDAAIYGGSDVGNFGANETQSVSCHGRAQSLAITLPPLATVWFRYRKSE
ncbi:MAG: 1,4-alpha-glucan branching protein GlgB [Pseudomonadota bacterium]|nr:1,4-alpha-glucan branching protein GlgB [Pseudomonadota bacterium]